MNARVLIIATICFFFTSCVKNAINSGIEPEKPNVELFDFNTKSKVDLSLNYGFTGYSVPFEVYVDNPLDEDGLLKSDISPIYGAFTDSNSSFNGKIELPSSVSNIYVYSDAHGAPKLLERDINDARAEYNYVSSKLNTRSLSYDTDC